MPEIPTASPENFAQNPSAPNMMGNNREAEKRNKDTARKARSTRQATTAIVSSRKELKEYLEKQGMSLVTSAVEFQKNGDFISSSYVIYPKKNNFKEPLQDFIHRYPQLEIAVKKINQNLRGVQNLMQIITEEDF
jgi:hypothetical protein